ncbi:hypothetical protein Pla22_02990 [Rubripirellula amarantea]|uniref:Gamma-butyrobetaine hydroxylase-like N-terminal domain-containing protein n=1 Tax=Rubripirellula amarantea TaxID=2527999 RepID=A0A5C5WRK6_9BACT|nr:DUF971 domain-containing protein [Rubripirellula amarantea]TWT52673.1 hypothetical protein Pla22_02990 [Rubripirellula amarantea]
MSEPTANPDDTSMPAGCMPESIERDGNNVILIHFNDGKVTRWTVDQLRKACPCATCREKKRALENDAEKPKSAMLLPVLSAAEARPLRIEAMQPVGQYGYNIQFSDGHSSGIFLFEILYNAPLSR